jgi:hypothetical protein
MQNTSRLNTRLSRLLAGCLLLIAPALSVVAADAPSAAAGTAAALYDQGVPWDKFLAGARVQRETWVKNAGREVPAALVDRFRKAGSGLRLLVVTADWCGDSVHSVPYIATLAARAGVDLRVVDFRAGRPVMEANRTPDGRASTPTVVLLRGDQPVAAWVERPASLQSWYLGMTGQISDEERLERQLAWYGWNRGADALAEIVVLAEQAPKKGS